jgi:hypothetical protein
MRRPTPASFLLPVFGLLLAAGCELPSGELGGPDSPPLDITTPPTGEVVWTPGLGVEQELAESSYVLGPEELFVYVGDELSVEVELLEPDRFALRAGMMPEEATFTSLPAGALVQWLPQAEDIGSHEVVLLVVDASEPNLVIAQEMFVIDVFPRLRFIEYGF